MSQPSSPSPTPHTVPTQHSAPISNYHDYPTMAHPCYHGGSLLGHMGQPGSGRNSLSWSTHNGSDNPLMTPHGTRSSSEDISSLPPLSAEEMAASSQNGSFSGPAGMMPLHHPPPHPFSHQHPHNLPYEPRFGSGYFNSPADASQANPNAPSSEPSSGRPSTSSTAPDANSIDSEQASGDYHRSSTMGRPLWGYGLPTYPRPSIPSADFPNTTLPSTALLPPYTTASSYPYYFSSLPPSNRIDNPASAPGPENLSSQGYSSIDTSFVKDEDDEFYDEEESPRPQRRYTSSRSGGNSRTISSPSGSDSVYDRHRGTGRKKIEIKPITTKLKRQITFSKRKTGLLKKVRELTTLTQTEALVILVSETGNTHTFATPKFVEMIRGGDLSQMNQFLDNEDSKRTKSK